MQKIHFTSTAYPALTEYRDEHRNRYFKNNPMDYSQRHKIIATTVRQYGRKAHIHRIYSGKRYSRYATTAPRDEGAEHQRRQFPDDIGKQGRGSQHSGSLSPRRRLKLHNEHR